MDWMICALRIAEIARAVVEGERLHGNPNRIEQVRAGFDHDDLVSGPCDLHPRSAQ